MVEIKVSLQAKWEQYLKSLAEGHQTNLNSVINEMCVWAFSNPEGKKQFEAWLDDAYPQEGAAEDKARAAGARAGAKEEEMEEESEEEAHEDRDYSEDREPKH